MTGETPTVFSNETTLQPEEVRRIRTALVDYVEGVLKGEASGFPDGVIFTAALEALIEGFQLNRDISPDRLQIERTVIEDIQRNGPILRALRQRTCAGEGGPEMTSTFQNSSVKEANE